MYCDILPTFGHFLKTSFTASSRSLIAVAISLTSVKQHVCIQWCDHWFYQVLWFWVMLDDEVQTWCSYCFLYHQRQNAWLWYLAINVYHTLFHFPFPTYFIVCRNFCLLEISAGIFANMDFRSTKKDSKCSTGHSYYTSWLQWL